MTAFCSLCRNRKSCRGACARRRTWSKTTGCLLLEEGHCLRDQALTYCSLQQVDAINTFGASSLSTIVEMVSAGLGITLLPEICVGVEGRSREIKVIRFVDPEPSRSIGLAWRRSSPRRDDFLALAKLVAEAGQVSLKRGAVAMHA